MPARPVNFLVGWSSGDTNTITVSGLFSVSKSGGGSQTITRNVFRGVTYSVGSSGSGPGSTGLRTYSNGQVGLDDRQGAGADGDYNDLTILPNYGKFFGASGGSCSYRWDAPAPPAVAVYFNGKVNEEVTVGTNVTVAWECADIDLFPPTGEINIYPTGTSANGMLGLNGPVTANSSLLTTPAVGVYSIIFLGTNDGGSTSAGANLIVHAKPVISSFTISNSSPIQGQSITLTWVTANASEVSISGNANAFAGGSGSPSSSLSGSYTWSPSIGGSFNATITAKNPVGYTVTETVYWTVRDETPNSFGWDNSLDSSPPGVLKESNTISINGFGPTQYPSSQLPIKSNYPVQVMVNGDGVWRDVQQI